MGSRLDTLWQSLIQKDLTVFKACLDDPAIDVNDKDRLGNTILHRYASSVESLDYDPQEIVGLLIQKGIDINCHRNKIGQGETALHISVHRKSVALCIALLDQGAEIDKQEGNGNTPLWMAVMAYISDPDRYGKIIELLLERGADPKKENNFGSSPLSMAHTLKGSDVGNYFQPG